jgi:hypothetical protein
MAHGFCAEIIVFRKFLGILVDSMTSTEGSAIRELEVDNSTMETLKNIEAILKGISLS